MYLIQIMYLCFLSKKFSSSVYFILLFSSTLNELINLVFPWTKKTSLYAPFAIFLSTESHLNSLIEICLLFSLTTFLLLCLRLCLFFLSFSVLKFISWYFIFWLFTFRFLKAILVYPFEGVDIAIGDCIFIRSPPLLGLKLRSNFANLNNFIINH